MTNGEVKVELETRPQGVVARVTLDNAVKANTLNTPLMERFIAAIEALAGRDELRVVVLTGAGGPSSAGPISTRWPASTPSRRAPSSRRCTAVAMCYAACPCR